MILSSRPFVSIRGSFIFFWLRLRCSRSIRVHPRLDLLRRRNDIHIIKKPKKQSAIF
jgi:hypothetical protein